MNQIGRGKRFEALRDLMAERYTDANDVAISYVNDATPGIYSLNRNYSAYTIDKSTGGALTMPNGKLDASWTLFDESTVRRLMVEKPGLMPNYPAVKALKRGIDLAYGKKQITSAITSAILQGKSIKGIADDLQTRIPDMNRASAIRTARTSITGAQNGGRQDTYQSAVKMGIKMKKQWLATLDSRTRHSHALLDGEIIEVGGKYSNGCRYPGDPSGKPHEVYNCRCTEIAVLDDVDTSDAQRRSRDPETGEWVAINDMTYKEWEKWCISRNPKTWEIFQKKGTNYSADSKQFKEYKEILGKKLPNSVDKFQNLKYNEPDKWEAIKKEKKQTVVVRNAPCDTTKKKYTGYFLKPGAKHYEDFANVGYTADDVLQLRYDMARQFDSAKAVDISVNKDGAETFNIYMNIGVDKKKSFLTGWQKDTPDSKPRIITAFRKDNPNDK